MSNVTGQNFTSNQSQFAVISYTAATITTITGNFLVIIIVLRNKKMRTTPNFLIVSMSVSDVFIPTSVLVALQSYYYCSLGILSKNATIILEAITTFLIDLSFAVSMQSLVAIAVQRYYAVFHPLKARLARLKTCFLIICSFWISGTVLFAPRVYYSIASGNNKFTCPKGPLEKELLFWDVLNATFVAVPSTLMVAVYSRIMVHLKRKRVPSETTSLSLQTARQKKQNINLSLMFITILILFTSSWGCLWFLVMMTRYSSIRNSILLQKALDKASILPQ